MRLAIVLLFILAGTARAETPTDRAKAIIETQRVLLDKDIAGLKALLGAMDPAGIVVGMMSVESPKEILEILKKKESQGTDYWARNGLQSMFWTSSDASDPPRNVKQTVKTTVSNLVAGGRADAVWFTFDLNVDRVVPDLGGRPFKTNQTFRITELAIDRGGWKVTLFHADKAMRDDWDELPSAGGGPPSGELFEAESEKDATLLTDAASSPTKLAKALLVEPSTIVLGSSASDRGVGPQAAKLVGGWSKLKLAAQGSIERKSKTWGFAVVRLDLDGKNEDQKMRLFATVIGLPKADGTWQIVTLRYSRIMWM